MSDELVSSDNLVVQDDQNKLRLYQFGSHTARHHFCETCGIHVFVETRLNSGYFRLNLGCVEGLDPFSLENKVYDGKSL